MNHTFLTNLWDIKGEQAPQSLTTAEAAATRFYLIKAAETAVSVAVDGSKQFYYLIAPSLAPAEQIVQLSSTSTAADPLEEGTITVSNELDYSKILEDAYRIIAEADNSSSVEV